mmetsp:Transcript_61578/g.156469  ORF Transcript_61578/g.156469 Transcript_61578/m.156469 type:complete len:256 (-) Transcript_61578:142-909(-)
MSPACERTAKAVREEFSGLPVTFLFNNAGISGRDRGMVMSGDHSQWPQIFSVNVFGAVNIIKTFVPGMVAAGPLPSGKSCHVVTTSSVVGLMNNNPGPYSVSKMAVTAVSEQFAIELEEMCEQAAHISPHSLHPTMAATNFFSGRDAEGKKARSGDRVDKMVNQMSSLGMFTAPQLVDGFFARLDAGEFYIIVDHPLDVPTDDQLAERLADQISRRRPRRPRQVFGMMMVQGDQQGVDHRVAEMKGIGKRVMAKL